MNRRFGNRGLRWLLLAAACLAAIGLFLLATATENTELFARGYDTLVVLNFAVVGLLMLIVAWQLWQLRRNLKRGVAALCIGGGEATAIAVERIAR